MGEMTTVILRIDGGSNFVPTPQAGFAVDPLSGLGSMQTRTAVAASAIRCVWHIGCLDSGREGLRVLGTRQVTGWGLRIPEIGRTGIFSPRN